MAFHLWDISEVYSNEDGTMQFIELFTSSPSETQIINHTITFDPDEGSNNTFNVPSNLSGSTAGKSLLFATEAFSSVVDPDYIIPDNFLDPNGGKLIVFGTTVDTLTFASLPLTGTQSLNGSGSTVMYSPTNFAGDSLMFGTGGNNNMNGGAGKDNMSGLGGADTVNGGVGNDTMDGGSGSDRLIGSDGNDRLVGGTGKDNLNGGAGADRLTWDALDTKVDGGSGTDTLLAGVDLVLSTFSGTKLVNTEKIDMTNGAMTTLTGLTKNAVLNIGSGNTLTVLGDAGDTVSLSGWTYGGVEGNFETYTRGAAILMVEVELNVVVP